jgi:hypothetical protein
MATVLKYFAQKTQDGYPILGTLMGFKQAPTANLVEIQPKNYVALAGQKVSPSASGLRFFVRKRADGSIIPNSLISGTKKPAGQVYEFKVIIGTALAAPSALSYNFPASSAQNAAITPVSPVVTGTVDSYAVAPALPAGLSLDTTTGVISGTPTANVGTTTHTITATNAGGSTTAQISVVITPGSEE